MGRYRHVLLAAGLTFMSSEALAAPPILDGTYIMESSMTCQYEINALTASMPDRVTNIFGSFKGQFEKAILILTFNDATKRVSGKGIIVRGDHVAIVDQSSQAVIEESIPINNKPFSNTATTLKVGTDTFKVFYGTVVAGKLKNAVFVRKSDRCGESGTITLVES